MIGVWGQGSGRIEVWPDPNWTIVEAVPYCIDTGGFGVRVWNLAVLNYTVILIDPDRMYGWMDRGPGLSLGLRACFRVRTRYDCTWSRPHT